VTQGATGRTLELVQVGPDGEIPSGLGRALDEVFGTRSRPGAPLPLDPAWRHPERGQWLSTAIVDALLDRYEAQGSERWVLGVTGVDLYVPERTFVFGEATVGGPCALVSLARLRAGADRRILFARLLTEAVHELGHLAGLPHCSDGLCAMATSADALGVDLKATVLCSSCRCRLLP
jgi:archaemetzincin